MCNRDDVHRKKYRMEEGNVRTDPAATTAPDNKELGKRKRGREMKRKMERSKREE